MSLKFLKKNLEPPQFNVFAFIAAVLTNLDTQIQFEHKAADSDQVIKESRSAISLKAGENGEFSCVVPLELVNNFIVKPYKVEVKTGVVDGINLPVAIMAFTPQESGPQLVSPNGHAIASETDTVKKALEKL